MSIEINSIVEGKVIKIKPFGAIVTIDNKAQGLVHISHISNNYVKDINEHIAIGDVVKVKVISIDAETGKIALSIKEANPTPLKQNGSSNSYKSDKPSTNFRSSSPSYNKEPLDANASFEDKFKEWLKSSNERQAGLNKRNKRR